MRNREPVEPKANLEEQLELAREIQLLETKALALGHKATNFPTSEPMWKFREIRAEFDSVMDAIFRDSTRLARLVLMRGWAETFSASADLLREAKGLLEALEMEGADSQEFYTWSMGLRLAIDRVEGKPG